MSTLAERHTETRDPAQALARRESAAVFATSVEAPLLEVDGTFAQTAPAAEALQAVRVIGPRPRDARAQPRGRARGSP